MERHGICFSTPHPSPLPGVPGRGAVFWPSHLCTADVSMFLGCSPMARRSAVRSRRRKRKQPARCRRLRLEALEDRLLLAANIWTDHLDYAPGATAQITGSGFAAGEPVQLQVLHTDQVPNTGSGHTPWIVTDGGSGDLDGRMDGSLQTTWYVNPDDSLGASFQLTASGLNSGEVATTAFTDDAYTITTDVLWSSLSPTPTAVDTVVVAAARP